jgi:uncharacterized protein YjcR
MSNVTVTDQRAMPPEKFLAWRGRMREVYGWSGRECARQLGCAVNQIKTWSERGAPKYIALACDQLERVQLDRATRMMMAA